MFNYSLNFDFCMVLVCRFAFLFETEKMVVICVVVRVSVVDLVVCTFLPIGLEMA